VLFFISIYHLFKNKKYVIKKSDILVFFLLIIGIVESIFFQKNNFGSPLLYITLAVGLLYFSFSFTLQQKIESSIIFWCVAVGAGIESILCFAQIFGLITNADSLFIFGGSFGNPGALAVYLSIASPFLLVALLNSKALRVPENIHFLLLACFISCIFWITFSNSRGAWLACIVSCFIVANKKYGLVKKYQPFKSKWLKFCIGIPVFLILLAASYGLYNYKKDSAFGRLFIWKVAMQHLPNNILFGNCVGAFEANYGKWQADYFATNQGTKIEMKVADYVTCAYNEYLEILVDNGVVMLICCSILVTMALTAGSVANNLYVLAAKTSIIAILITACIGYPFKLLPVLLHLSLCGAIIFHFSTCIKIVIPSYLIAACLFPILCYCLIYGITYTKGFHRLNKGLQMVLANKPIEGIKEYEAAYQALQNNGVFLFYYAGAKAKAGYHSESIALLEKAITKESDPNAYILLGNQCAEIKDYPSAVVAYTNAANIVPSKLYPKYLLAKLYLTMGQPAKAKEQASQIMLMDDKVHSTAADEIRNEMSKLLKNNY